MDFEWIPKDSDRIRPPQPEEEGTAHVRSGRLSARLEDQAAGPTSQDSLTSSQEEEVFGTSRQGKVARALWRKSKGKPGVVKVSTAQDVNKHKKRKRGKRGRQYVIDQAAGENDTSSGEEEASDAENGWLKGFIDDRPIKECKQRRSRKRRKRIWLVSDSDEDG